MDNTKINIGDKVLIKSGCASFYIGRTGIIKKEAFGHWYFVLVEGRELILDSDKDDFEIISKKV